MSVSFMLYNGAVVFSSRVIHGFSPLLSLMETCLLHQVKNARLSDCLRAGVSSKKPHNLVKIAQHLYCILVSITIKMIAKTQTFWNWLSIHPRLWHFPFVLIPYLLIMQPLRLCCWYEMITAYCFHSTLSPPWAFRRRTNVESRAECLSVFSDSVKCKAAQTDLGKRAGRLRLMVCGKRRGEKVRVRSLHGSGVFLCESGGKKQWQNNINESD